MPRSKKISCAKRRRDNSNKLKQQSESFKNPIKVDDNVILIDTVHDVVHNARIAPNFCQIVEGAHTVGADVLKMITNPSCELDDRCINAFLNVLTQNTSFQPQDTIYFQAPHLYQRVTTVEDIQILYGGGIGSNVIGHWTCVYYDGSVVHVYDSLNKQLSPEHHVILNRLYSRYHVKYENTPIQPDGVSCGIYAIAIATSLALKRDPSREQYFVDDNGLTRSTHTLRRHLLRVLEQQTLTPFPTKSTETLTVNNRSKVRTGKRANWWDAHKDEINQKRRADYATNAMTKCKKERLNYAANPEEKKTHERNKYSADPEAKKSYERQKYSADPERKTTHERERYMSHPDTKKTQVRRKYLLDPNRKKLMNSKYYHANREIGVKIQKLKASNTISQKYRRIEKQRNSIGLLLGSLEKSIVGLTFKINPTSTAQARIEAEKIVKWCMSVREGFVSNLKKLIANSKRNAELCLIRATESSKTLDKVAALCGDSKHTGSSECYFVETAYNIPTDFHRPLEITMTGQVANLLPVCASRHVKKSWGCDSLMCAKPDSYIIDRLEYLLKVFSCINLGNVRNIIKGMNTCTNDNNTGSKLGHSETCYANPATCKSKLLPLQILSAHYPRVRYFIRQAYEIIKFVGRINAIDHALGRGDLAFLRVMSNEAEEKAKKYRPGIVEGLCLDEDVIIARFKNAFETLAKRSMDTPRLACISCDKLCFRRDVVQIDKLRKPMKGVYWSQLKAHLNETGCHSEFLCSYCADKFRKGNLPATCVLNGLAVKERPVVISSMNEYEKILIQRAKAFQTVQRMGTVMKKNIPHTHKVQKVKGRTFHLPLPLEETLKKLPSATDAINLNHELFILVCGIPNKARVVWSKLVDVNKVHDALIWLKNNNSFYKEIKLPVEHESLLESLTETENVEIQIETEEERREGKVDAQLECDNNESVVQSAMLTRIVDSEAYCEQYTIYPIHEGRENRTSSALYQLLSVKEAPLSDWDKSLDVMCFPDLYPYGINGQHQIRTVHLRDCDFIKCRLMSKHSAFRLNQQYLFYLLHECNLRQLKAGIFHKMNIVNPRDRLSASAYLEMMSKEQLEGNLTTVFARLRNTEQYWSRPRNNLGCMVQNYGPATWFLTLSPSEWMWNDLAEYIRTINGPQMTRMSTSELVATDPVSASRYLDNKFHAMLSFICSSDQPIGEVTHYFWRREYQGRGMQHFHMLIWIKDAPVIGDSATDEVAQFITKYVTCKIPCKRVSPMLYRRVDTHQRHKHNSYCLRNKKNKHGYSKVCRFGFPRPITESLVLRDVGISIAGRKQLKAKSRLYDLPRTEVEACINDYNPVILTAWEGNMDMQFIGEKSTLLNWYCTKYTTKAESCCEAEMINDINSTKSLRSRLWGIALRSLTNRECGALEAADTLLGISLYGTDPATTIKWLDVNQVRNRKLKSFRDVKALDSASTDIFFPALIDDHYPNRPEELESVNLYDFARFYDITRTRPVDATVEIHDLGGGLHLKKRRQAYLINHYRYNVNVQPEKYFFALLLLFKPWRDTDELKHGSDSYAEAFDKSKTDLMEALRYHERLSDIQKGLEFIKEVITKNLDDLANKTRNPSEENEGNQDNPLGFQPVEAGTAMEEFNRVEEQLEVVDMSEMISQLNTDQKRVFDHLTNVLKSNSCNEIVRLFVSGAGGTGKSFLIKTIRCWTKQILNKATAVTAPTGLAAFNIDGLTIHRFFQLPIEHGGTPKYKELSDQVLKILREEMKDVVLFVIDEVSMISNVTLVYIHLRLSEIFNTKNTSEGWFGGKHILLLGDLLQLPPVNDDSAFINLSKDATHKYFGSLGMINLWSQLFSYDELTINMRQQGDFLYKEILDRIRFGIFTSEDIKVLESKKLKFLKDNVTDRLEELCEYINQLPVDTVCLFSTRNQCAVLNTAMLGKIQKDEIELNSEDSVDCVPYMKKKILKLLSSEKSEDTSRTAGLSKTIIIKIGAKVMVRRNIDVTLGIVNGTIGHVTSVSRAIDTGKVESLTIVLSSGRECTIEKVSTKFEIMNGAFIFRKQFPLSLSYGITIHKCQGLSLKSAVMDIGNTVFTSGQAYVALSRLTSLEGLHVINLDPHMIKVQEAALLEYNRLRLLYRPDLAAVDVSHKKRSKVKDIVWSINNTKHLQAIQTCIDNITDKKDSNNNAATKIVGINNNDNVSCYANSVIQCLFHCNDIIQRLKKLNEKAPLGMLARSYGMSSPNLNSLAVRAFAGQQFLETVQHDAAEFLMVLCDKSHVIGNAIGHELIIATRCNNCGLNSQKIQPNYIATLPIDIASKMKSPKNLQELLDRSFSKSTSVASSCVGCDHTSQLQKISITSVKGIIVMQLMLFNYKVDRATKITDFKINSIPTSKVIIDGSTFQVSSAIFHHGDDMSSGHYTAILRDDNNNKCWLRVNDMQVRKTSWPRGAKDAYIFVLTKVS